MEREVVLRKIKSLLALTESDNENEALSAAQAARKLMMKYHISVEEDERKEGIKRGVVTKELRFRSISLNQHHLMLATALAKNFRCRIFYRTKPVSCICFVGYEEDAYAVLMLMEYLVRFMEQGAKAYRGNRNQEFSWKDGFCVGVYASFQEQDREGKGYEIMTAIPREVDDAFGKLKLKKGTSGKRADYRASDGAAFSCGEMSGRRAVDGRSISGD